MTRAKAMSNLDILRIILNELGSSWKFSAITSARLAKWMGDIPTTRAKSYLERLMKAKLAGADGVEGARHRIEKPGRPCITYALHTKRVENMFLIAGIDLPKDPWRKKDNKVTRNLKTEENRKFWDETLEHKLGQLKINPDRGAECWDGRAWVLVYPLPDGMWKVKDGCVTGTHQKSS